MSCPYGLTDPHRAKTAGIQVRGIWGCRLVLVLVLAVLTGACAPAFTVIPTGDTRYAPTETIEVLFEMPDRPYRIIASFSGREGRKCPEKLPYCSFRQHAQAAGAHAIWVRKREILTYPGDWIMLEGRLTKLHPFTTEHVEGVLIRFTDRSH